MKSKFSKDRWWNYNKLIYMPFISPIIDFLELYRDEKLGLLAYDDNEFLLFEHPNTKEDTYLAIPTNDFEYFKFRKNTSNAVLIFEPLNMRSQRDTTGIQILYSLFMSKFSDSHTEIDYKYVINQEPEHRKTILYRLPYKVYEKYANDESLLSLDVAKYEFSHYYSSKSDIPILLCIYDMLKIYDESYYNSKIKQHGKSTISLIFSRLMKIYEIAPNIYDEEEYKKKLEMEPIYLAENNLKFHKPNSSKHPYTQMFSSLDEESIASSKRVSESLQIDYEALDEQFGERFLKY